MQAVACTFLLSWSFDEMMPIDVRHWTTSVETNSRGVVGLRLILYDLRLAGSFFVHSLEVPSLKDVFRARFLAHRI